MGHYLGQCPNITRVGLAKISFLLTQSNEGNNTIKKSWILLDMCSPQSVSKNTDMVTNVKSCSKDDFLKILINAGHRSFKKEAKLKILPMLVHFNEKSMATILSMKDVANLPGVRIHMESEVEKEINVFYKVRLVKLKECEYGLYFLTRNIKE